MKKLAVLLAIISVAVLAAPALSATNPFMDVPMNHWAYDAIGQLAAHGILSGYPDGLYKGKQPTTRYEMASALARALAVVDMTKASKQDVEMLKRLVVEFKDELEALGVRVDELDERVRVLENRLGGWHIHGTLVLDVMNESRYQASEALGADGDGSIKFDEARLFFERTWGENDEYFFRARLRNEGSDHGGNGNSSSQSAYFDRFYVEMPFFFDTRLLVGRNNWAWEGAYKISLPETGGWTGDQTLTDWTWTGFGLTKNFGMGQFQLAFAHPDQDWANYSGAGRWKTKNNQTADLLDNWMIMARGTFQFTENIGLDIGGQAFIGDNAEYTYQDTSTGNWSGFSFNNMWTIFAGLRFNFNENIALKGTFYHQKVDTEYVDTLLTGNRWENYGYGAGTTYDLTDTDNANHWSVIIDVKQEALKFTSLWLEYGQYDKGFTARNGTTMFYSDLNSMQTATSDLKYWRVGLGQQWTDQWATYLFYYGYKLADDHINSNGDLEDRNPYEVGVGVQYKLNDYTTMGLNYMHADGDKDDTEDNVVRFRTAVSF